jgi:Effector protein
MQSMDLAVMFGHEPIHAEHMVDGTHDRGNSKEDHSFSENGVQWKESWYREEFRTVGQQGNRRGDVTENQLRKELGVGQRPAYLPRDNWIRK